MRAGGGPERVLGDRPADRAVDTLGPDARPRRLRRLAALLGAVGVADRHADHSDRVVDAGDRIHAGNPPAGADDHAAVDRLAQDLVRAPDVVGALGRDGGGLDPVPGLAHRPRGRQHDLVAGPRGDSRETGRSARTRGGRRRRPGQGRERLLEQLLARLVPLEHDNPGPVGHRPAIYPRGAFSRNDPRRSEVHVVWKHRRGHGRLQASRACRRPRGGVLPAGARRSVGDAGRALGGGRAAGARRDRHHHRVLPLRGRARRPARGPDPAPRRASHRRRVLLGGPSGGVGEGGGRWQ